MFATTFSFFLGSSVFVTLYYLPIWFQAIQGVSPIMSAVHSLPLIICQVLATFASGILTTRIGYYMPFVYISVVLVSVGCGLLSTMKVGEPTGRWIGYQIVLGSGIGFGFQQSVVAIQSTLKPMDISMGIALVYTGLYLGGAIFVSAGQNVFSSNLRASAANLDIPGLEIETIIQEGATALRTQVPNQYLGEVLVVYSAAVTKVFQMATIVGCLTAIGALGMEWKNLKRK
jgi:hypothetical protein